uniref:Uncharacterized protein n=1 Tax=Glossina brevipalpis TaxID=37001 RepID=A0A1A9X259_9MUSC
MLYRNKRNDIVDHNYTNCTHTHKQLCREVAFVCAWNERHAYAVYLGIYDEFLCLVVGSAINFIFLLIQLFVLCICMCFVGGQYCNDDNNKILLLSYSYLQFSPIEVSYIVEFELQILKLNRLDAYILFHVDLFVIIVVGYVATSVKVAVLRETRNVNIIKCFGRKRKNDEEDR